MNELKDEKVHQSSSINKVDPAIEVIVYTDPLCCWSWAFQDHLEKLQNKLAGLATWNYKMGGLISSWKNFHDEINNVTRPIQMGPVWMHAGQIVNKPIQHLIWMKDPPASSYPACIAVKCAQLQQEELGAALLKILWQKCMAEGKNIAKRLIINEAVKQLVSLNAQFDVKKFNEDFENGNGMDAFRSDLELALYYRVSRFPSIIVKPLNQKPVIARGYRNYHDILNIFSMFLPNVATH